jgi:hypothetical protein
MCRATERKQEKAEAAWEKRLQTLREENEAAYKRQSDFCTKVASRLITKERRHKDIKPSVWLNVVELVSNLACVGFVTGVR